MNNNHRFSSRTALWLLPLLTSLLIACGGSSGGSNNDGGSTGNFTADSEVSKEDFDLFSTSGTWKSTGGVDFSYSGDFEDFTGSAEIEFENIGVAYVIHNSDTDITVGSCEAVREETLSSEIVEDDFFFDTEEDDEFLPCDTLQTKFYKADDSNYKIELLCDSEIFADFEVTKLSDTPAFNFGTVAFTSEFNDDLAATSEGVCGSLDREFMNITADQPGIPGSTTDLASINFAVPYGDHIMHFSFEMHGALTTGTFDVVSDLFPPFANKIEADVTSTFYGGSAEFPDSRFGIGGTVTIDSVGADSASGSFDLEMVDGDNLVGTFSFDLN